MIAANRRKPAPEELPIVSVVGKRIAVHGELIGPELKNPDETHAVHWWLREVIRNGELLLPSEAAATVMDEDTDAQGGG